jgi:hypothetical protein
MVPLSPFNILSFFFFFFFLPLAARARTSVAGLHLSSTPS